MKKIIQLIGLMFIVGVCNIQNVKGQKINGISFVSSRHVATQENVDPVVAVNANYAAIMPFGWVGDKENPELRFDTQRQWYGETRQGVKEYIEILHKNNVKTMLKPQIWIRNGEYTGFLKMNIEEDWKTFEESYSRFIIEYATLAEEAGTDMYCIGTELEAFTTARPAFWNKLIKEVRKVYSGSITYAANWDEYKRISFWGDLDYIGVDAYFPLCEEKTPTEDCLISGWKQWEQEMQAQALLYEKQILFTEFGYRSVDFTGKEPWKSDRSMTSVNLEGQTIATKVIFEKFWNKKWIAGGFLWKWFIDHKNVGGLNNSRFTPQNKPVEQTIRKFYEIY